jgi:hypothetical protein
MSQPCMCPCCQLAMQFDGPLTAETIHACGPTENKSCTCMPPNSPRILTAPPPEITTNGQNLYYQQLNLCRFRYLYLGSMQPNHWFFFRFVNMLLQCFFVFLSLSYAGIKISKHICMLQLERPKSHMVYSAPCEYDDILQCLLHHALHRNVYTHISRPLHLQN